MILALIAAACLLDVDTGNDFHMAILPDARVALTLRNATPSNETVRGCLKVRDFFGHGFDLPVDARVAAGVSMGYDPIDRKLLIVRQDKLGRTY